jgi:ASC-1-like (ASCH) protein
MMIAKLRAGFPRNKRRKMVPKGRKLVHAKLNKDAFQRMTTYQKKMEFRLRRGKWATLQAGDVIQFTNADNPHQSLTIGVEAVLNYPSLSKLLCDFDAFENTHRTKEELLGRILKRTKKSKKGYYTQDEEKRYGVIGIKIGWLNHF